MHFFCWEYVSGIFLKNLLAPKHALNDASFFHDGSILDSMGIFLTHLFETVGVFADFLCVNNTKNALYLEL